MTTGSGCGSAWGRSATDRERTTERKRSRIKESREKKKHGDRLPRRSTTLRHRYKLNVLGTRMCVFERVCVCARVFECSMRIKLTCRDSTFLGFLKLSPIWLVQAHQRRQYHKTHSHASVHGCAHVCDGTQTRARAQALSDTSQTQTTAKSMERLKEIFPAEQHQRAKPPHRIMENTLQHTGDRACHMWTHTCAQRSQYQILRLALCKHREITDRHVKKKHQSSV